MLIRPLADYDRRFIESAVRDHFGSHLALSRGKVHDTTHLDGLVARDAEALLGFIHFEVEGDGLEVVTLVVLRKRHGVGRTLLACEGSRRRAALSACLAGHDQRQHLGARFLRGLRRGEVHVGSVAAARVLKPEIPLIGEGGIPIEDKIEFELVS